MAAPDGLFGVAQQEHTPDAFGPALPQNDGNPVQIPGPVRHGRRRIVGEADRLARLLVGDGLVAELLVAGVIFVEDLAQGDEFVRLEDVGAARDGYQRRRLIRARSGGS